MGNAVHYLMKRTTLGTLSHTVDAGSKCPYWLFHKDPPRRACPGCAALSGTNSFCSHFLFQFKVSLQGHRACLGLLILQLTEWRQSEVSSLPTLSDWGDLGDLTDPLLDPQFDAYNDAVSHACEHLSCCWSDWGRPCFLSPRIPREFCFKCLLEIQILGTQSTSLDKQHLSTQNLSLDIESLSV